MDRSPFAIAVAAAMLLGSPAAAEKPATPEQQRTGTAQVTQAKPAAELKVELAERRDADQPVVTKRPRAARVSTCRCGDLASQQ